MARKKKNIPPFYAVKFDFVDSLDHLLSEVSLLLGVVETAISIGAFNASIAPMVTERLANVRKALLTDDGEDQP